MSKILVEELYRGFHKVTDCKTNTFEYLTPEKLAKKVKEKGLKVVKIDKEEKSAKKEEAEKSLNRMNKSELLEIASRYGNTNEELSNKELINFIETEQAKG